MKKENEMREFKLFVVFTFLIVGAGVAWVVLSLPTTVDARETIRKQAAIILEQRAAMQELIAADARLKKANDGLAKANDDLQRADEGLKQASEELMTMIKAVRKACGLPPSKPIAFDSIGVDIPLTHDGRAAITISPDVIRHIDVVAAQAPLVEDK